MTGTSCLTYDSPLTFSPLLAAKIGMNEAVFLQQLQYWISQKMGKQDEYGRRWIYNTVKQWNKQFPFWSERTIKRIITNLESEKLLLSVRIGDGFDKKKAYTINYDRMAVINQEIVHAQAEESMSRADEKIYIPAGIVPVPSNRLSPSETLSPQDEDDEERVYDLSGEYSSVENVRDEECQNDTQEESQKVEVSGTIESANLTRRECQNDPTGSANLTRRNTSPELPKNPVSARDYTPSPSRTRAKTTTENTQRITTTPCIERSKSQEIEPVVADDLISACAELNIPEHVTVNCIRRYGESAVRGKAKMLRYAHQRNRIENAAGWLIAALKDSYVYTPSRDPTKEREKFRRTQQEQTEAQQHRQEELRAKEHARLAAMEEHRAKATPPERVSALLRDWHARHGRASP